MTQLALDMPDRRITVRDAFENGTLRIEIDPDRAGRERFVHVISRAAGGEVRGYELRWDGGHSDGVGTLHLRAPAYEGPWEELDAEVSLRVARELGRGPLDVAISDEIRERWRRS